MPQYLSSIYRPDVVVLGSGGIKGFMELGALCLLEDEGMLTDIDKWVGCSVGSALSLLIVCGFHMDEIIKICWNVDIMNDMLSSISKFNINKFKSTGGLIDSRTIRNLLEEKVIEKFGKLVSFQELYMCTGKDLYMSTYNISKNISEVLSRENTPHLSVVHAAMLSLSIPGIFKQQEYRNCKYCDGSIKDPYPVHILDDGKREILGFYVNSFKYDVENIPTLYKLIHGPIDEIRRLKINSSSDKCTHVELSTRMSNKIDISATDGQKERLLSDGYDTMVRFKNKILRIDDVYDRHDNNDTDESSEEILKADEKEVEKLLDDIMEKYETL
jgi:predicted acylesterase/phospholipase RssA